MSSHTLLIANALDFACRKHVHQRRKGESREPYINHLAEVAHLVAEATGGTDAPLVAAALLHDCIEDQGVTRAEIAERFGEDVAMLVMEVTDDKSTAKEMRKQAQVDHAAHISDRAKILKIADKTSNLRAIQHSPPPWPLSRKRRYFAWARAVVAGARGQSPAIEAAFDAEYEKAVAAGLADRDFVWHMALETEGDD
jgi:(p)ppGpp synthase/HD superfamily hydrolase